MNASGQQGSGRDRSKPKDLRSEATIQGDSDASNNGPPGPSSKPSRPGPSSGVRRLFRRRGVCDVYRLNDVEYRLDKKVGSGKGEAKGKSEAWRATQLGPNQRDVFLKIFQSPKYPSDEERSQSENASNLLKRCNQFEARHRQVGQRLSRDRTGSGALVKPLSFGLPADSLSYVKVYPWVHDAQIVTRDEVSEWSQGQRLIFLRTLMLAVWELHSMGIVHGDIKPENILIADMPVGKVARLIDFDEAFLADSPPTSLDDADFGTTLMTPEWKVLEDPDHWRSLRPLNLGTRSDLFQLAIVLETVFGSGTPTWQILDGGDLSDHADFALAGASAICCDLGLSLPRVKQLLESCLDRQPLRRPSVELILSTFGVTVQ